MDDEKSGGLVRLRENSPLPTNLETVQLNELSSTMAETIKEMARTLKGNRKTPVLEKSQILTRLMKAYADLVKTHRLINGLDSQRGGISAGVIIIPGKSDDWVKEAGQELAKAKDLVKSLAPPDPEA